MTETMESWYIYLIGILRNLSLTLSIFYRLGVDETNSSGKKSR